MPLEDLALLGLGLDVQGLAGAPVVAVQVPVLPLAVDDVRVARLDGRLEAVAGDYGYVLAPGQVATCAAGYPGLSLPDGTVLIPEIDPGNSNDRNCTNDGYVTDSSWGYRMRASLTYNDVFAGINLTPGLAWSHDVDGYSPNSNFNEGAKALTLSLAAEYLNRYTGSLAYTTFSGGDYNTIEDRDFLSLSVSVSF